MDATDFKAWRKARALTQRQMADMLGMSVSRIADYEAGESRAIGRSAEIPRVVELAMQALKPMLDRRAACTHDYVRGTGKPYPEGWTCDLCGIALDAIRPRREAAE